MRYIFITLVLANIIILAILLIDKQYESNDAQTISGIPQNGIEEPISENIQTVIHGKPPVIDSLNEVDALAISIKETEVSKNYLCVKIESSNKEALVSFLEQNGFKNSVLTNKKSVPAFNTLYIAAASKNKADDLNQEILNKKLVKDSYVTKIAGEYSVSIGVFSKEAGLAKLERIFKEAGYQTKRKQGYRDYDFYHQLVKITDYDFLQLKNSSDIEQFDLQPIKDKKNCIL